MDYKIQLNEDKTLRFHIQDLNGKDTGEYLEFNMGDIDLLNKYEEVYKESRANETSLRNKLNIISKKQDHKSKNELLSDNERAQIKAMQDFYHKETKTYNKFLGENGVQKLLNGRPLTWTTLGEISEIIEKEIQPKLQLSITDIQKEIKNKYSIKESDVIDET